MADTPVTINLECRNVRLFLLFEINPETLARLRRTVILAVALWL